MSDPNSLLNIKIENRLSEEEDEEEDEEYDDEEECTVALLTDA